jgi:hypothetical protein
MNGPNQHDGKEISHSSLPDPKALTCFITWYYCPLQCVKGKLYFFFLVRSPLSGFYSKSNNSLTQVYKPMYYIVHTLNCEILRSKYLSGGYSTKRAEKWSENNLKLVSGWASLFFGIAWFQPSLLST